VPLSSIDRGGIRIVRVESTRIDAAGVIRFKEAMRACIGDGPDLLILDLEQVEFIDSSGLGAIIATMKQLGEKRMALAGLGTLVEKVFRLTRMDSVFAIHPTVNDALRAAGK